jgi:hypothetical protein
MKGWSSARTTVISGVHAGTRPGSGAGGLNVIGMERRIVVPSPGAEVTWRDPPRILERSWRPRSPKPVPSRESIGVPADSGTMKPRPVVPDDQFEVGAERLDRDGGGGGTGVLEDVADALLNDAVEADFVVGLEEAVDRRDVGGELEVVRSGASGAWQRVPR